ncbi:hypothetical protein D3C75_1310660 [compost metagenome]
MIGPVASTTMAIRDVSCGIDRSASRLSELFCEFCRINCMLVSIRISIDCSGTRSGLSI